MRPRSKKYDGQPGKKNDHRRTRTCNLLVPLAIEAKRATIAPGSLRNGSSLFDGKCQSWRLGKRHQTTSDLVLIFHTSTIKPVPLQRWLSTGQCSAPTVPQCLYQRSLWS